MSYREFAPPSALANVIECVWTRVPGAVYCDQSAHQTGAKPVAHAVLPDGAMDIIATFHPDGELDETFVVGSMTTPQIATLDNYPLVGVRFLPGVGGSALRTNAATLTDEQVAIEDVLKRTAHVRAAFRALRLDASSAHAVHLFANSIELDPLDVPALVRHAAKLLGDQNSPARVGNVADVLGITRQHLARVFSAHAGLTPKLFAQICRVRALLAFAQSQSAKMNRDSWSQLSARFGYTDQSHLIAEVHAIIGQTPAAWQAKSGSNIPIVPVPVAPL